MKRTIVLMLMVGFVLSAFAGGQDEAGETASQKTIVLRGVWMENERKDVMKATAVAFESQNPNVEVDVDETVPEKLLATLAAKQPIHLIWANDIDVGTFADKGMVVDLGERYMKNDGGVAAWEKKMSPAPVKPLMWKGEGPYMVATYWLVMLSWMNMDILRDNGLELPQLGWTPDDLAKMSEKVSRDTNNDGQNDFFGLDGEKANSSGLWWFLPNIFGSESLLPPGNKPSTINNSSALEALTWLTEMGSKGFSAPKSLTMESGKIMYTSEGSYRIPAYQKIGLDCEPAAPLTKKATVSNGYSGGFFIVKSTQDVEDVCWEFIKVASEPKWQIEFAKQAGFAPLDAGFNSPEGRDFLTSAAENEKTKRHWKVFQEFGKYGTAPYPNVPNVWSIIGDIVDPLIEAAVAGKMDPAEVLAEMEKQVNEVAEPYFN